MSAIHTLQVEVSGGRATPMESFVVHLYATTDALGGAAYLSDAGTGLSVHRTDHGSPGELLLFYQDATTPSYAFLKPASGLGNCTGGMGGMYEAYNVSPGYHDESGQTPGGYLGLDEAGDLCFALPTDGSWNQSKAVYRMAHPEEVGEVTSLECQQTSAAPEPVSGVNYSSGCPEIRVDGATALTLVAN